MRQVERHLIKPSNDLYSICDDLTFKSKNLYNAGLYQIVNLYLSGINLIRKIKNQY